ncbi:NADH-cytochrome b5 reductase [Fusarium torreyae]|uniref:NADH-cytochrome b5 reductase 2 n=1 Tax=Fusarium torreyae TaxID=1237075 RepID=A0A9W8RRS8_9HYPO|nr:NADH-cytochrome b5 reductase [Fusarium torreyae]
MGPPPNGGTGINPLYQLARAIFDNPNDRTKVTLIFGNATEEDILLRQQLSELEKTYPDRFRASYVLSKPSKDWIGDRGHISKDLLQSPLPNPRTESIKLFVCGPPGLVKAIFGNMANPMEQGELTGALRELGYTKDQVYKF